MIQFDIALMNGTTTWWQMELPSGEVFFGAAKAGMLNYPESKFKHYQDFVDLVHPDDREKTMQAMRDHLSGKVKLYEATYRIKDSNGVYLNFYDCGQVIKRDGDKTTVIGFVLKMNNAENILEQMKSFKELIVNGDPSIIDLVAKSKAAH